MTLMNKPLKLDLPVDEIVKAYDNGNGESVADIAERYGCSRTAIKLRLTRAGVKFKSRYPPFTKNKRQKRKKKPVVNHEEIAAEIEQEREEATTPKRRIGW